jgi:hypothetical protein
MATFTEADVTRQRCVDRMCRLKFPVSKLETESRE